MNLYALKDGDTELKVITNLNQEEILQAIDEKDKAINYDDSEEYAEMTDYEVLERIVWEQGDYIEDVMAAEWEVFILNEKLEGETDAR